LLSKNYSQGNRTFIVNPGKNLKSGERSQQPARPGPPAAQLSEAALMGAFLDHLEHERSNSVRTRNARLVAVHSLFSSAALAHPQDAAIIQRALAIPPKRFDQTLVTYLAEPETDALRTRSTKPANHSRSIKPRPWPQPSGLGWMSGIDISNRRCFSYVHLVPSLNSPTVGA
jgi:hypothetical protein